MTRALWREPGFPPHATARFSLSSAGLANTYFWIDPTERVGGLIMTQILPFADPAVLAAYHAFERAIYDKFAGVKAA
jgi:methyl acetate hydrolase